MYFGKLCLGLFLGLVGVAMTGSASAGGGGLRVMGWLERVVIQPEGLLLEAKLDTGAKTSSIDAKDVVEFARDGKKWVRFSVSDRKGRTVMFERPVVRVARIRRGGVPVASRPVVMMFVCLGNSFREVEVNLGKRAKLSTPMLIGRTTMEGRVAVDSSRRFTAEPDCSGGKPEKG